MTTRIQRHAPKRSETPQDRPQHVGMSMGSTLPTPGGTQGITVCLRDDNGAMRTSWYTVPQDEGDQMHEDFTRWQEANGEHEPGYGYMVPMSAAQAWFRERLRSVTDKERL